MIDPQLLGESILQGLTLGVMLVGLFGLVVPVFPGLLIMWLATLFYALLEASAGRMIWIDWVLFAFITLLMIFGQVIDNIIIARRMRGNAIPWLSIGVAYLGGLFGTILLAPFVTIFTPLVGVAASIVCLVAAERVRLHSMRKAFTSARNYMVAWGWSFMAVFGVGVLMIVLWLLWAML